MNVGEATRTDSAQRACEGAAPSIKDARTHARSSLVLRTAKVVCQSGEYICIARDVSPGGVGLRFLHEVPPEPRILLELANGEVYPIERAWSRERDAGYRFAREIVLADYLEERSGFPHREIRLRVTAPALLTAQGRDSAIWLTGLSRCGAAIRCERRLPMSVPLRLELPGRPARFGHVCWRNGESHGLVFQEPLSLAQLAGQALELQPFASDAPSRAA